MSPLIDLETLAQLASPTGEGSVTLSMQVFTRLIAELRELRAQLLSKTFDPPEVAGTRLTPSDRTILETIRNAAVINDGRTLAQLLHIYYGDADRADRTPRPILYLHIGLLAGLCVHVFTSYDTPN